MSTELSIFGGLRSATPGEVMTCLTALGQQLAQSRIMGISTPGDGLVVAITCASEGITPLEFARTYHIIEGRPSMKADAMLAKFKVAGGKVRWIDLGDNEQKAEAEFEYQGEKVLMSFTAEQAKKMVGDRFDKKDGNWFKLRPQMLRARLVTTALRVIAPELIVGIYTPEEIEEISPGPSRPTTEQVAARREELTVMASEPPKAVIETVSVPVSVGATLVDATAQVQVPQESPPSPEIPFATDTVIDAVVEQTEPFPAIADMAFVPDTYVAEAVRILCTAFGQTADGAVKYLKEKLKLDDLRKLEYRRWKVMHSTLIEKAAGKK